MVLAGRNNAQRSLPIDVDVCSNYRRLVAVYAAGLEGANRVGVATPLPVVIDPRSVLRGTLTLCGALCVARSVGLLGEPGVLSTWASFCMHAFLAWGSYRPTQA